MAILIENPSLVEAAGSPPICLPAFSPQRVHRDAYNVTLITDVTGAQTEEIAQANIRDIANIGVTCMTTREFLGADRP